MAAAFTFHVRHMRSARVCVVEMIGKLDPTAVGRFDLEVEGLFRDGLRRFVFDAVRLDYIGSLGLRVLVGLAHRVKADGAVAVAGLNPEIRRMFELTRVNAVLRVHPTGEDAVDAVRS